MTENIKIEMTKDGKLVEYGVYCVYTRRTDILEYRITAETLEKARQKVQNYISGDYEEVDDQPEPDFVGVSDEIEEVITEVIRQ